MRGHGFSVDEVQRMRRQLDGEVGSAAQLLSREHETLAMSFLSQWSGEEVNADVLAHLRAQTETMRQHLRWLAGYVPAPVSSQLHIRLGEEPIQTMAPLVEQLADQIAAQQDMPFSFSFFGHSLGGLVAFELAHCLRERGLRLPHKLVVSACHAPRCRSPFGMPHELADGPFIELLRTYEGTPEAVLANSELMELLLPTIPPISVSWLTTGIDSAGTCRCR